MARKQRKEREREKNKNDEDFSPAALGMFCENLEMFSNLLKSPYLFFFLHPSQLISAITIKSFLVIFDRFDRNVGS